jgi:uncharacterized membrane protein
MVSVFGFKFHPHGVTVHFPIALYFTAALFLTLGLIFTHEFYEQSSYYVLIVAAPFTPLAYATGFYYWRTKYKGYRTPLFDKKLILGAMLWLLGFALVVARGMNPVLAYTPGIKHWLYTGGVYLAAVLPVPLGYLGGKLVFKE